MCVLLDAVTVHSLPVRSLVEQVELYIYSVFSWDARGPRKELYPPAPAGRERTVVVFSWVCITMSGSVTILIWTDMTAHKRDTTLQAISNRTP